MVMPGRIPAGVVSSALLSHTDLVPTMAAMVGLALPPTRTYDGVDLSPLIFGNGKGDRYGNGVVGAATVDLSDKYALHADLVHVGDDGTLQAVRVGDYKVSQDSNSRRP